MRLRVGSNSATGRSQGQAVAFGGSPTPGFFGGAGQLRARIFGVRSAIPMARAVRLCSDLVIVGPTCRSTGRSPQQVFEIFHVRSRRSSAAVLDEAYLDVTENAWNEPLATPVARRIKTLIRETNRADRVGGSGRNNSRRRSPRLGENRTGLTVIPPQRIESFRKRCPSMPVGRRSVTAARLRERHHQAS